MTKLPESKAVETPELPELETVGAPELPQSEAVEAPELPETRAVWDLITSAGSFELEETLASDLTDFLRRLLGS
ncbi:unnamed protein product [Ambrosiozyma monospora]|uniref:Unnamed protein product n=1 Tax=Ambrosiozyma monospora TaxID=43982 RepID=A0A9W6YTP6_AMBMO|nr:unnamed protein product [Ambrosiozyma monospora]